MTIKKYDDKEVWR